MGTFEVNILNLLIILVLNLLFVRKSDGTSEHTPGAWSLGSYGIPSPTTSPTPLLLGIGPQLPLLCPKNDHCHFPLLVGVGHGHKENQGWV